MTQSLCDPFARTFRVVSLCEPFARASHMATHTPALLGCAPCVGRRRTRSGCGQPAAVSLCRPSCSTAASASLAGLAASQPVAVAAAPRVTRPGRRGPSAVGSMAQAASEVGIGDLMQHLLSNRIIFVGRVVTDVVRALVTGCEAPRPLT